MRCGTGSSVDPEDRQTVGVQGQPEGLLSRWECRGPRVGRTLREWGTETVTHESLKKVTNCGRNLPTRKKRSLLGSVGEVRVPTPVTGE